MANIFDSESPYVINGKMWIGPTGSQVSTAFLHLAPGTATPGTAPLKLTGTSAVLLTTPEDGAIEYDGSSLYFTIGSTRSRIALEGGTTGVLVVAPTAVTSGLQTAFTVTGAANTGLTASTEDSDVNLNLARTVQWATGALTTQRAVLIQAPTYAFVGASTITNAATVAITAAPTAGTNATITNAFALWVQAGTTELDGGVVAKGTTPLTLTQSVATTGSPSALIVTGAAHTTLAAGVEAIDVNVNLARTVQFATGALTTQRGMVVQAPTYAFVGASTITTAATFDITGAPVAGTNATITNAYALRVEAGLSLLAGGLTVSGLAALVVLTQAVATTGSPVALTLTGAAHTTLTASAEANDVNLNLARTVQFATGALTTQRAVLIQAPTYAFVGASTITNAATLAVAAAPTAGTNATITNNFALWVQAGLTELDGGVTITGKTSLVILTQAVATTGSPTGLLFTGAAHTTLTASAEAIDVNMNLARTVQFATGALTTQRAMVVQAPTYAFVGASTITNAATLVVTAAPTAGTNATITNNYALWVQAGTTYLQGGLTIGTAQLLASTIALTNNAAAQAGTLTNSPTAGNPTKWIPINDNGTIRNIPAW